MMTPASLIAWRERLGLSRAKAARLLGISRNSVAAYEQDPAKKIPRYIPLACTAIENNLHPPIRQPRPATIEEIREHYDGQGRRIHIGDGGFVAHCGTDGRWEADNTVSEHLFDPETRTVFIAKGESQ